MVRLLSKSRQACALLRLSPRKKAVACTCQPIETANKAICFNDDTDAADEDRSNDDATTQLLAPLHNCFCEAGQQQQQQQHHLSAGGLSLLDIKHKVMANEYYSMADFNYDMLAVTSAAACDELMTTYKEIVSEQFPWFQNETKACTDALEEDMYDSCQFQNHIKSHSPPIDHQMDQQVPMLGIPDDLNDMYFGGLTSDTVADTRQCLFCRGIGEATADASADLHSSSSRLLYCGQNGWAHTNCAMWSAEVFEEIDGSLQNVHSAISRGRLIKCSKCGCKGATVGCNVRNCGKHYHYPCAHASGVAFMLDKSVYCPQHWAERSSTAAGAGEREINFDIIRPVYVELDRKKKKFISPSKIQFMIGSLKVRQLGKFVNVLSDTSDAIVPADFVCTRLYWSTKEPWKIVEYTVRTCVETNSVNVSVVDTSRNIRVDHVRDDRTMIENKLAQIAKWHESLLNGEDYEMDAMMASSNSCDGAGGGGGGPNEDEPQNNANDLLPPEIKDAIFEDLPHDILDGISMLDIFPKLMTYDDLVAMDTRSEHYLNSSDISRDAKEFNLSEDDDDDDEDEFAGIQQKSSDYDDNWMGGGESLLSAAAAASKSSAVTQSRELKRCKSEIFAGLPTTKPRNHRSASLTWSCKIDSAAASKRRKVSKFDLRLPTGKFC